MHCSAVSVKRGLVALIEPAVRQVYPRISGWLPSSYWDRRQRAFFNTYGFDGQARKDDHIYRAYLEKRPQRLLDIGCGYGRLFPLYEEMGIPEVVGIDMSPLGVRIARKKWPEYEVLVMRAEELSRLGHFDAAISNHTLSYVLPGGRIERAISNIAEQCKSVLPIEVIRGEVDYSRSIHDYESLFHGKMLLAARYWYSPQCDVMIFEK